MADPKKRLSTNIAGEFFVDSSCIDCDACRQLAPSVFSEVGDLSAVTKQPVTPDDERQAWRALLACPVAAIGCTGSNKAVEVQNDFPLQVEDNVFYCGYNSRKSYGANAYLIIHPDGNWMVEAPRYVQSLAERIDEMGGVKYIFLSHRDDVADADRYASRWKSTRIIHEGDLSAQPDAEMVLKGTNETVINKDFVIIPTPGHSIGHCVLLHKNKYLFTGDHLYWNRQSERLSAFEDYCWYSWDEQKKSIAKLIDYDFEWVLPGHGQSALLSSSVVKNQLRELASSM